MKIEISGSRCINCQKYNQYFTLTSQGELEAIDCGYCGKKQCRTRPGNRCKDYRERGNVGSGIDTTKKALDSVGALIESTKQISN